MGRKSKFQIDENEIMDDVQVATPASAAEPEEKQSNVHPNSLANLHPRKPGRTEKKYMTLDIYGYEEYLNLMSKAKGMTRTKYIKELIRKDFEENQSNYELLKQLKENGGINL